MKGTLSEFSFIKKKVLFDRVLFIDGMGISGKHMLAPILSTYKGVEISRADPIFEHISNFHFCGRMNLEAAVTMMRYALDEDLYDSMIGRNTNFRPSDASSVFHAKNEARYLTRLLSDDEGEVIVKRIQRERPIFQNLTHEILSFPEASFKAFGDNLRIIEMLRHPLKLVERWLNSGWGDNRYERDPRSFVLTVKKGGRIGAYFSRDFLEHYHLMSPTDRVIHDIHSVISRIMASYRALNAKLKAQVVFVKFENFVTKPYENLDRIASFVGIQPGEHLSLALAEQNCPRILPRADHAKMLRKIFTAASAESRLLLRKMIDDYENFNLHSTADIQHKQSRAGNISRHRR